MYRSGADVRHMLEGEEKQRHPALKVSGTGEVTTIGNVDTCKS
jgi:hypothetical protein